MTCTDATPSGIGSCTNAYEQLRSEVIEGGSVGGHFGLVILLREGVAAWITHAPPPPTTAVRVAAKDRPVAAALIPDGLRADIALVLASMVMTAPEEKCA
ncbi:MAG: hypothetical protein NTZ61_01065 [Proteobacteria bacterium]|nr:hypothetical protein [Pseudomonadota bacterium]